MKISATLLFAHLFPLAFCYRRSYLIQASLEEIVGTTEETLDAVQTVFANVDNSFNNDFTGLDVMDKTVCTEALKFVLSKTINLAPQVRAFDVVDIIHTKLYESTFKLSPDDTDFRIVQVCLEDIIESGMISTVQDNLRCFVDSLVSYGSIDLLRLFLDAGVHLADQNSIAQAFLKDDPMPLINCLLDYGLVMSQYGHSTIQLFKLPSFKAFDFDRFLRRGLPLHFKAFAYPWIELAMQNGRLDLAHIAYRHGQNLKSSELTAHRKEKFKRTVDELVQYICIQCIFERVKVLLEATYDKQHALYGLPLANIYAEMFAQDIETEAKQTMYLLVGQ